MSGTDTPVRPARPRSPARRSGGGRRGWWQDLSMGMRFAVGGGKEGWVRTLLTAVGVGLGVALLLGAASTPSLMGSRDDRATHREVYGALHEDHPQRSERSVLVLETRTDFGDRSIAGRLLHADGDRPALPPGVSTFPEPGEMLVSPALRELLAAPGSELLRERFDDRVVGTIGDPGLVSPQELYYYAGSDSIAGTPKNPETPGTPGTPENTDAQRTDRFAPTGLIDEQPLDTTLIALVTLMCVVLLTPVAIFIGTAVRFGGEHRDRRLAALRLVGADARTVRRIAGGEALLGALLGLGVGVLLFLAGRQLAGSFALFDMSAFPGDVRPEPALGLLVLLAVPVCSVLVTLVSLRAVTIEPLGVVRRTPARRRRLWWRVLLPVAGLAVLLTQREQGTSQETANTQAVVIGSGLLLFGLVTLLPWLVEIAVARLRGGPVPWQLATRRLQMNSGSAARAVSGISVAVAGAVALQMLIASMSADYRRDTGQDPARAQLSANAAFTQDTLVPRMKAGLASTEGVESVLATVGTWVTPPSGKPVVERPDTVQLAVADCATVREMAGVKRCADGDTFVLRGKDKTENAANAKVARPGERVDLAPSENAVDTVSPPSLWRLPADARTVPARADPDGTVMTGIVATPGALDVERMPAGSTTSALVRIDPSVPDAAEHVRNTLAAVDPSISVSSLRATVPNADFAKIQNALQIGATLTMTLIALSMLVTMIEQLRERRRLLAALAAFGTRRSAMAWSVLWQTAVPMALGLVLAVGCGFALGAAMVRLTGKEAGPTVDVLPLAGAGVALVLVVTLLSLPPLYRMMRPNGLRTE